MSFFNFGVLCEKTIFQETRENRLTNYNPKPEMRWDFERANRPQNRNEISKEQTRTDGFKISKEHKTEEGGISKVLPYKFTIGYLALWPNTIYDRT
jgi:hypothetical protein